MARVNVNTCSLSGLRETKNAHALMSYNMTIFIVTGDLGDMTIKLNFKGKKRTGRNCILVTSNPKIFKKNTFSNTTGIFRSY